MVLLFFLYYRFSYHKFLHHYLDKLLLACQKVEEELSLLEDELQNTEISDEEMAKKIKGSRLGLVVVLKLPIVEKQLYAETLRAKQKVLR